MRSSPSLWLKRISLVVGTAVLVLTACGGEPSLLVTVLDLPDAATNLRIQTSLNGQPGEELNIPPEKTRFVIQLPAGSSGQLTLRATALDGGDCKIATAELTASPSTGLRKTDAATLAFLPLDPPLCTLTMRSTGPGGSFRSPSGQDCASPAGCQEDFRRGTQVPLYAQPDLPSHYMKWSGDCTGNGACNLTMDRSHRVEVTFPSRDCSPDGWCAYNPLQPDLFLSALATFDQGAFIVGDKGRVLKCSESGCKGLNSPVTADLKAVVTDRQGSAWVVGNGGTVIKCYQSDSCQRVVSNTSSNLTSAWWDNTNSALWAVGQNGIVLRCIDGKCTSLMTTQMESLHAVCVGSSLAWVVGDAGMVQSCGTSTCTRVSTDATRPLQSVGCDGVTAWVTGDDGKVLSCTGSTCTVVYPGMGKSLGRIFLDNAVKVWSVGDQGTVIQCSGTMCTPRLMVSNNFLRGAASDSSGNVWVCGDHGTLLSCNTASCAPSNSGTTVSLRGLGAEGLRTLWAFGDGGTVLRRAY